VVVAKLYVGRTCIGPCEAQSVLVVDPDAVLTRTIGTQWLQTVGRWNAQVLEPDSGIQHGELPHCNALDILKFPDAPSDEQALGSDAPERDDGHDVSLWIQ
jgi:hypothetical protein